MRLATRRFDLSGETRVPNTPRRPDAATAFPTDFPIVFDEETGQIVEPILLFMRGQHAGPLAFEKGAWTKRASAVNVAADLRAWWTNLHRKGRDWRQVDDRFLADYLKDMRLGLSSKTLDYLGDGTFKRRLSSIAQFYSKAVPKYGLTTFPSVVNAKELAQSVGGSRKTFDAVATDIDPHPIDDLDVQLIGDALGPLPSERKAGQSSRTRLAFELGVMVGLRVDEIVNLTAAMFRNVKTDGHQHGALRLRITHTKGLNPRPVLVPNHIVDELKAYIAGERAEAIAKARDGWLKGRPEPVPLLVNQVAAGANAGKQVRTATIEEDFNAVLVMLEMTRTRVAATGTRYQREVTEPKHVFHDCRHTYAVNTFDSLRPDTPGGRWKHEDPIRFVQRRLGHRHPSTTEQIYLNVFKEMAGEAVEQLMKEMKERRDGKRIAA